MDRKHKNNLIKILKAVSSALGYYKGAVEDKPAYRHEWDRGPKSKELAVRNSIAIYVKGLTLGMRRKYRQELVRELLNTPLKDIIDIDVDFVCKHRFFNSK